MKRLLLLGWLAILAPGAWADPDPDEDPGRGVARISVINGDVSVRRADSGDWVAAAVNAPLLAPDSVLVGAGSRAEVQLDYANLIRLGPETEVRFASLENRRYRIQVARGTVTFSVLRDLRAEVDLSTPNVSVRPSRQGAYRVSVRDDGTSEITVRSGEAEIFTPRGTETLRPGKTMLVRGTAADPEFQILAAIPRDDWDHWNEQRDRDLRRSGVYRYVSRDIYGAEDLDSYGRWVYVPPYGWVWAPYVAPGWAPYRYGRWAWLDFYGWTWIGYDPWGWAPYHYGRWFYHGPYGWCWWPGGFGRHYWRPALVAFFGWGGGSGVHFGFGVGFGRVGWVPLAPYEPFYPWYGPRYYRSRFHVDNSVNIVNHINITNIYRNARVSGGITAVEAPDFGRGRVANVYRASEVELRRVNLVRGELPVVPQRESLRFAERDVRVAAAPSRFGHAFAGRSEPPAPERVPFSEHQRRIESLARQLAAGGQGTETPRLGRSRAIDVEPVPQPGADGLRSGWRRAQEPGTAALAEGWRRFGEPSRPRLSGADPSVEPFERRSPRVGSGRDSDQPAGWRRFGEPARTVLEPRSGPRAGALEPSAGDRLASPREGRSSRLEVSPPDSNPPAGGWERFGRGRGIEPREPAGGESFGRALPPLWRTERGGTREAVPISPPIVRERPSPRIGGGSPSRGGWSGEPAPAPRWGGGSRAGGESPGRGGAVFEGGPRSGGGGGRAAEGSPRAGHGGRGR